MCYFTRVKLISNLLAVRYAWKPPETLENYQRVEFGPIFPPQTFVEWFVGICILSDATVYD